MLYLYWILFFLENFLDYEKLDVRIKILKCHKLTPPPPKRRSDVFRSKIDLRVAPYYMENFCDPFYHCRKRIVTEIEIIGMLNSEDFFVKTNIHNYF